MGPARHREGAAIEMTPVRGCPGRACDRVHQAGSRLCQVRYRGLKKNTHRLLVTCALANLFMARRHLLRCQEA
jgi:hypothetical protein